MHRIPDAQVIGAVDVTQDGSPLRKYVGDWGVIAWGEFRDAEEMTMTQALNLLLIKIIQSEDRASDIGYAIQQLQLARQTIEFSDGEAIPPVAAPEWKPLQNVQQASGRCPICGEPNHDFDCR